MPTYTALCLKCGEAQDYIRRIAQIDDVPVCCAEKTTRMLAAPMVGAMTWTGHASFYMLDGTPIEDGAAYKRYLDKNNLVPESEGHQEHVIQKTRKDEANKKQIKQDVIDAYRAISNKTSKHQF